MQAQVLVELKAKGINQTYTYEIPNSMNVKIGCRVIVPFGCQKLEGFVLDIGNFNCEYELKNIEQVIDLEPVLTEEMLKLGKYMQKKTLCNLILCYQTMLPKALKAKKDQTVNKKYETYLYLNMSYEKAIELVKNDKQKQIIDNLKDDTLKSEMTKISAYAVQTLIKNKIIKEEKEVYRLNQTLEELETKKTLTSEQENVYNEVLKSLNKFTPFYFME